MKLKNIITKLYLSLGLIVGISLVILLFSHYVTASFNQNNQKRIDINNKIIFFESILGKHESYVKDILNSIVFQTKFTKEIDYNKCAFGEWYNTIINSNEFNEIPKNVQKSILSIDKGHKSLHRAGDLIQNKYIPLDRELKDKLMRLKMEHMQLQFYIKKQIDAKKLITRGLNHTNCKYGLWWNKYKNSDSYHNLTTENIKRIFKRIDIIHEKMHKTVHKMEKLQKQNRYKEVYAMYSNEYKNQSQKMVDIFDTIIEEINIIDKYNENIRDELKKIIPPSLKIMQDGLHPYQEYLKAEKNLITDNIEENSEILNTISIILTILNIFIIIIVAYWIRYELVEQIRYLKDRYKDLKETQSQLIESEKMASLGGMVAGVAHEINTPVGMALTAVTHLEEETKNLKKMYEAQDMSEEDFENYLEDSLQLNQSIYINLDKAASLVRSFKQVAVDQTSNHDRKFNFEEYTQEILQSLHSQLKKVKIKIELAIDEKLEIHSNPGAFSQILSNFIMNSITHGIDPKSEGVIRIEAIQDEDNFILKYSDNGKGMDKQTQEKIFDPFFTTNREKGGSGLGMNIIFNLVTQKLHGKIELETGVNRGVVFTIKAPIHYKSNDIKKVSPL